MKIIGEEISEVPRVKGTMDCFRVDGSVAVVTGASAGLGATFAQALARAGAKVVIAARRTDLLEKLSDRLNGEGADVHLVGCDVSKEEDVENLVKQTEARFGQADILVNNAARTVLRRAEDETLEEFTGVVGVNLVGLFLCSQRFGRGMLVAGRGVIVNVASILGLVGAGQIRQAGYCASKGGVVNLTRELAAQWARRGVRVNCLAPGWFHSEMTDEMFNDGPSMNWLRGRTPMGRSGEAEELVGPLLFLASEASSFMTGQVIAVDGGWTIV